MSSCSRREPGISMCSMTFCASLAAKSLNCAHRAVRTHARKVPERADCEKGTRSRALRARACVLCASSHAHAHAHMPVCVQAYALACVRAAQLACSTCLRNCVGILHICSDWSSSLAVADSRVAATLSCVHATVNSAMTAA
eukprot:3058985-Prymnesium_polylepis.2